MGNAGIGAWRYGKRYDGTLEVQVVHIFSLTEFIYKESPGPNYSLIEIQGLRTGHKYGSISNV
jgi:hypothetical protein